MGSDVLMYYPNTNPENNWFLGKQFEVVPFESGNRISGHLEWSVFSFSNWEDTKQCLPVKLQGGSFLASFSGCLAHRVLYKGK